MMTNNSNGNLSILLSIYVLCVNMLNYILLKETSFFDVWMDQRLKKCLSYIICLSILVYLF